MIALSFLFVVYDGTKSIADQTIYISRVASTWKNIHPSSLSAVEPAVETLAGAWVWNDVIQPYFLEQPTALVLVVIGALRSCLGARRSRGSATRDTEDGRPANASREGTRAAPVAGRREQKCSFALGAFGQAFARFAIALGKAR